MKKTELIEALATAENISKAKARRLLEHLVEALHDELHCGSGRFRLAGVGVFKLVKAAPRNVYVAGTGERRKIGARMVVRFKAERNLKKARS